MTATRRNLIDQITRQRINLTNEALAVGRLTQAQADERFRRIRNRMVSQPSRA